MESPMMITAAAVQMAPRLGDLTQNRNAILDWLEQAAAQGADLVVFPECALSGYVFQNRVEGMAAAEPVPGPSSAALVQACQDLNLCAVVGMLEVEGDALYNTALVAGQGRILGRYRKAHLPFLGVDRYANRGPSLDVVRTRAGVLGPLICYDMRFPEAPRVLALLGAEIIVHPTNWPNSSVDFPGFVTKATARSSQVFVISADRVGTERGTTFLGRSQIIAPSGQPLAEADDHSEMIITAGLELGLAHRKKLVMVPGEFEMDLFGDRRPELYGRLMQ
jgi:predicted amidohydrolase